MSRFIETLHCRNGILQLTEYHRKRACRAREEVLGLKDDFDLLAEVVVPPDFLRGNWKCRILYGQEVDSVAFLPHRPLRIESLRLVKATGVDYAHKYAERSALEALYQKRGDCDDILMVKEGMLTDSYVANVVLWNGREWITPDTPLLPGCMRASLIHRGIIRADRIRVKDLEAYSRLRLINALNSLEDSPDIPLSRVYG